MQKISIGACVLAFGGFLETNALKIQSKLQEAAEDHPKPHAGELAQRWYGYHSYGYDRAMPMVAAQTEQEYKSTAWNEPLRVTFENASHDQIELFWHDYSGNLVSYGQMGPGQTMLMYTYATHPWSATGNGDFNVDGDAVWVPVIGDNDRTIQIHKDHSDFTCDRTVNWMNNGPAYSQISLTDGCGMHNGICDMNPVYAADGHTNNNEEAIAYCQEKCVERIDNGDACEGFFFQKHNNGHEICGFYYESMSQGEKVWGGH